MSYASEHNSFTRQYLLNIYIYCRFCRLYIINCEIKRSKKKVCDSEGTLIIAVLKSVARKRLVKTEDFYVSCDYNGNWSVWFSGTDVRTAHINLGAGHSQSRRFYLLGNGRINTFPLKRETIGRPLICNGRIKKFPQQ
jgi:hypothetical protein